MAEIVIVFIVDFKKSRSDIAADTFNPSTQKAEPGGYFLSLRPAWSTQRALGQPELHNETLVKTKSIEHKDANRSISLRKIDI